MRDFR